MSAITGIYTFNRTMPIEEGKLILNTVNIMTSHGNEERFYDVYNKKTLFL